MDAIDLTSYRILIKDISGNEVGFINKKSTNLSYLSAGLYLVEIQELKGNRVTYLRFVKI